MERAGFALAAARAKRAILSAAMSHDRQPTRERPQLKPVENLTLRDQVTQSVRGALMNGHFEPGQVVTVKAICEMVGASVMPAREAMNRLIAEGALELRANRSVRVPVLSRAEFDELTALRCHVEAMAAAQAVQHVGPEHLAQLRELDAAMHRAARKGDPDAYLDANFRFHFVLYELGASRFLLSVIETMWVRVGPLIRSCMDREGFAASGRLHSAIVQALEHRDEASLRNAIVADIAEAALRIRQQQERADAAARAQGAVASMAGGTHRARRA